MGISSGDAAWTRRRKCDLCFYGTERGLALGLLRVDEARDAAEQAKLMPGQTEIPQILRAVSSVCAIATLTEDWAEAASAANDAFTIRASMTSPFTFFDFYLHREVQALLRGGHESQARELVMVLNERTSGDEDQRRMHLVTYRMKAALHRWEGDEASAVRELEQALELAQSLNVPGELWQISAELAATHALAGDRTKAAEMFKVSRKTIDALAHGITDPPLRKSFRSSALRLINASAG